METSARHFIVTLALSVSLCSWVSHARGNLLLNGGFESPEASGAITSITLANQIAGWTFSQSAASGVQFAYLYEIPAYCSEGDQCIGLISSTTGLIRTVTSDPTAVTPNAPLTLGFDLKPIFNGGDYASTVEVLINGAVEATYLFAANAPPVWTSYSLAFDVPVASVQVGFRVSANGTATGDAWYVAIDNVTVVPEPDSLALLGVACIGLVGLRRRRARRPTRTATTDHEATSPQPDLVDAVCARKPGINA